jgi:hypothetical protein
MYRCPHCNTAPYFSKYGNIVNFTKTDKRKKRTFKQYKEFIISLYRKSKYKEQPCGYVYIHSIRYTQKHIEEEFECNNKIDYIYKHRSLGQLMFYHNKRWSSLYGIEENIGYCLVTPSICECNSILCLSKLYKPNIDAPTRMNKDCIHFGDK